VYQTAYKTPLGTISYWLVFKKSCHLLVKLEQGILGYSNGQF